MKRRITLVVDRIVPSVLRDTPQERQARLLIVLVLLVVSTLPLTALAAIHTDSIGIRMVMLSGLLLPLALLILRRTGSVWWAGQYHALIGVATMLPAMMERGFDSSGIAFLMVPVVATVVIVSPRDGLMWGSISIAAAVLGTYGQRVGWLPPAAPASLATVVQPLVVGSSYAIAITTYAESSARSALATAARLAEQLAVARDEAQAAADARSQFVAHMSHELRTPLSGVIGMVQLMRTSQSREELDDYVATLESSAVSLMTIVNDVLDLSKIESGHTTIETRPTAIAELVSRELKLLEPRIQGKPIELTSTIDPHVAAFVLTDPSRLRQILGNVISNAIKFTEAGRITVTVSTTGPQLTIDVDDTGVGIPKARLETIFEPFRQADETHERRFGGTGLGLPISRRLAELLGGSLSVESTVGHGSTFRLRIPYSPCCPSALENESPQAELPAMRVLVVDDHPINRKVAAAMLTKMGVTVETEPDGRAAVQRYSADPNFDLIFMDWEMPELNGGDATAAIRRLSGGDTVPIVALTAHVTPDFHEICRQAGLDGLVPKPIIKEALATVLRESLSGREGITSLRSSQPSIAATG